jgi:hypothetical protein
MLVYSFVRCYTFPAIDSNDECTEEGEILEYQEEEEDQGQATKASHLFLMHI